MEGKQTSGKEAQKDKDGKQQNGLIKSKQVKESINIYPPAAGRAFEECLSARSC
jgi:hypothetical protein